MNFELALVILWSIGEGETAMQNSIKYIIKTGSKRTYILHIMDAVEFQSKKYIGLFLYHDEENTENNV